VECRREATNGRTAVLRADSARMAGATVVNHKLGSVQRSPLFSEIGPAESAHIVAAAQERNLSRRQTLFFVGDPVRQLWLLTSGCVKVMQVGPSGCEVILRVAGPGEMVGDFGVAARDAHRSSAQALQPSRLLVWETAVFDSLSDRFPLLRRNMLRVLNHRLHEMDERFREISTEKVAPRLSSQLGRLLLQMGNQVEGGIEINLSREELAQLTGTTLFTVSRMLSRWEQDGIVKARREAVLICDSNALVELAEGK
jgi:CRP/FNR family transcriptional regulator, nitrogen oxide reductase regulator